VTSSDALPTPVCAPSVTHLIQSGKFPFASPHVSFRGSSYIPRKTDLNPSDVPIDIGECDDTILPALVMG